MPFNTQYAFYVNIRYASNLNMPLTWICDMTFHGTNMPFKIRYAFCSVIYAFLQTRYVSDVDVRVTNCNTSRDTSGCLFIS